MSHATSCPNPGGVAHVRIQLQCLEAMHEIYDLTKRPLSCVGGDMCNKDPGFTRGFDISVLSKELSGLSRLRGLLSPSSASALFPSNNLPGMPVVMVCICAASIAFNVCRSTYPLSNVTTFK